MGWRGISIKCLEFWLDFSKSFLSFLLLILSGFYQDSIAIIITIILVWAGFCVYLLCTFLLFPPPPFPASSCTFKLCPFHSKSTGINSSNFNHHIENIHSIKYKHTQSHTIASIPPPLTTSLFFDIAFSSPSRLHLVSISSPHHLQPTRK